MALINEFIDIGVPPVFAGKLIDAFGGGGGSGTVTSVSVTTANGVSGTVANPTTTPAITLSLGNITPTSVAAGGNVTGTNLSGTNTGDQTITLTGDVTGSGTGSFAATIANDAVTYAKIQNVAANSVLARADSASGDVSAVALSASQLLGRGDSGDVAAITLGSGLSMSGTTLSSSAGFTYQNYTPTVTNATLAVNYHSWYANNGERLELNYNLNLTMGGVTNFFVTLPPGFTGYTEPSSGYYSQGLTGILFNGGWGCPFMSVVAVVGHGTNADKLEIYSDTCTSMSGDCHFYLTGSIRVNP